MSTWLKIEYEKRKTRNPYYSMRAFSRDIGISSGRLSELFQGKRFLGPLVAERIAQRLNYTPEQIQEIRQSILLDRKKRKREMLISSLNEGGNLAQELITISCAQTQEEVQQLKEKVLAMISQIKDTDIQLNIYVSHLKEN